MKSLLLCIAISLSMFSCTNDNETTTELSKDFKNESTSKATDAANPNNPFDQIGLDYYNHLKNFELENGPIKNQVQLIKQLLYLTDKGDIKRKTSKSVITITPEMIAVILADPENKLIELINDASLSISVKNNLTGFVNELVDKQDDDYDDVHNYILDYEDGVIADSVLIQDEKDTILKVSAISRYSLYAEARKRDRDWETSVTNKPSKGIDLKGNEITLVTLAVVFNNLY
ncbi:hypothetical protein [Flavobacterium sp. HBTb2-11-1]|uniref:hypothetical protein n=1 Tax=Flavobacterium sp. HBTb2-11-1 TaxID=2692212 RepID=UPI00136A065B|nr:hypothetical protein [Flavobacterium sp. HBTb2-11-1]MXO04367.1 hypothetical protein [Flavobacterium sp. HBTb2-11-1]